MAKFETDLGLAELIKSLSSVDIDAIAPIALSDAAPIVADKMRSLSQEHSRTGAMVRSIKTDKPKQRGDAYTIFTGPSGVDPKTGVRNMEKLAYLEYGVKGKQVPTPILLPTIKATEEQVMDTMQDIFSEYLAKLGL